MRQRTKSSGALKSIWQAYQERNKRYEQMTDAQKEMRREEDAAIAEHNRRLEEKGYAPAKS
jgi:hypothetical protein